MFWLPTKIWAGYATGGGHAPLKYLAYLVIL